MASINAHPAFGLTGPKKGAPMSNDVPIGDSSFLQNVKYDPANYQLTVTMKSGAQYVHFQVYPSTFQQMMEAPSKGKFYADVIKKSGNPSQTIVSKSVGPQNRNPLKGPTPHERNKRK